MGYRTQLIRWNVIDLMLILFLYAALISHSTCAFKNAIELGFPFKIDFVLLKFQNQYLEGGTLESRIYNIQYVQQHLRAPDSILITPCTQKHKSNDQGLIEFRVIPSLFTATGFKLTTRILSSFETFLIGYMTIVNGFGVNVYNYVLSDFGSTDDNVTRTFKKNSTQLNTVGEIQKQSLIISGLKMDLFDDDDVMSTEATNDTQHIIMYIKFPKAADVLSLDVQLFIHRQRLLESKLLSDGFSGYQLRTLFYDDIVTYTGLANVKATNTNESSVAYFIGGIRAGKMKRANKIGVLASGSTTTSPETFNSSLILERLRNQENTAIICYIYSTSSSSPGKYTGIWLMRNNCSDPDYPYLSMIDQRCYDLCPKGFYNNSLNKCNNCLQCTNINQCMYCHHSMCNPDQYYIHTTKRCANCTTIHPNCQKCYDKKCTQCTQDSDLIIINGTCLPCTIGQSYIHPETLNCESCFGVNKCSKCYDESVCTECRYPYKMTSSYTCLDCEYPYVFDESVADCIVITFSFTANIDKTREEQGIYHVEVVFETNVSLVVSNYNVQFLVDQVLILGGIIQVFNSNNTIQTQVTIPSTIQSSTFLQIQFVLIDESVDVLTKHYHQENISRYVEPPHEPDSPLPKPLEAMKGMVDTVSQNSGSIMSTFSMTSLSGYVVGILWNFQIASYYIFLKVQKPRKLIQFLNITIQMQNINILPFEIPTPYSDQYTVKGDPMYQQYDIDLYFLRSNFQDIMSLLIFSIFYYLLYLMFSKLKSKYSVFKFIKGRLVDRVYENISMNFYSIITVIAFTAAATLSTGHFGNMEQFVNQFAAGIALLITFAFSIMHPIILFRYKGTDDWDTEECYVGLNRQRKYSQFVLSMFLISQMIIPAVIPLLHPVASLSVIISSSVCNLILLIKVRTVKIQICIYYRILSQLSWIFFNFLFVVCFIIEKYFPGIDVMRTDALGQAFVVSMAIVIILEFVEMITEIVIDVVRLIRKLKLKAQISELDNGGQNIQPSPKGTQPTKKNPQQFRKRKRKGTKNQSAKSESHQEQTLYNLTESTLKTKKSRRKNKPGYNLTNNIHSLDSNSLQSQEPQRNWKRSKP